MPTALRLEIIGPERGCVGPSDSALLSPERSSESPSTIAIFGIR
jgi:hypothetical protein